jgi:DNA replication and repair protein RecF
MYVERLHLKNYRNFNEIDINLNKKLNIFIGNNAQGKTNLLESIFVSSIGKSFRFSKDENLITKNMDYSKVNVKFVKESNTKDIEIDFLRGNKKKIRINGLSLEKYSDLVGLTNVVVFSPDSINLIKGSPVDRRRYLNVELSQIKPNYKYLLTRYNKILIQRNNLIKKIFENPKNKKVLPIWNEHLINTGTDIIMYRLDYLKRIEILSRKIHEEISGGTEILDTTYRSNLGKINNFSKNEIKEIFHKKIEKSLDREIIRKSTLYGPHLDDIEILINGMDSKFYSSQGQKRTAALSLVMAEIDIIYDEKDEYPVLLLDDVLSELDNSRKNYLIKFIDKIQTIITSTDDTDLINILRGKKKNIFYVENGNIKQIIE